MTEYDLTVWGAAFDAKLAETERLLRAFEQALVDAGLLSQEEADSWPR